MTKERPLGDWDNWFGIKTKIKLAIKLPLWKTCLIGQWFDLIKNQVMLLLGDQNLHRSPVYLLLKKCEQWNQVKVQL